jgi:DNA mismatch repair ATPase MutL
VSRDALRGAEVVGQAFDKFVVIRAGAQLVVVDQHAADERVRLEEMEVRVPVRGAGPAQWRSACTGMHGAVLRPR